MPRANAVTNEQGETVKAGCVVISKRRKILLAQDDRYAHWSLPKGHVDAGESPEQAAVRETYEETGWEIEITRQLGEITYLAGQVREPVRLIVYLAKPIKQTGEPGEKPGWFTFNEIKQLVKPSVLEFLVNTKLFDGQ